MRKSLITKAMALLLSLILIMSCLSVTAFAEEADTVIDMIAGDVITGFVPAGTNTESSDPAVAWVDSNGSLNAMKSGSATVTVKETEETSNVYTVNVSDYSDGTDIVGNLKILARYNDSMQFYDGHVYLLFTSYQDGVEIKVYDLYAAYEISDQYYDDIRADISNGSNHTGNDTDKYFTFRDDINSVTLNRGEIVTIGMYRDFDLSVPQAALGSIQNSTYWQTLVDTGKSAVIESLFKMFNTGQISADEIVGRIKAVFDELGMDYSKALNGVVDGGVCFNRELYNQKLEWDQYENVTYEMDITRQQLGIMSMYLNGNLNNFSIMKNSCATVALRAWNAAVGTRNGADTAYKLSAEGEGIFSMIDAPKGVRDNIVERLPGYYLNNSECVNEPGAGYQDDTGWVYVSAPENVRPVNYIYADDSVVVDDSRTKMADLVNAAKGGTVLSYNKDEQDIGVNILSDVKDDKKTISRIEFTVNGTTVTLDNTTGYEGGIWFKARVDDVQANEDYYVLDGDGNALPSVYNNGYISFFAQSLPVEYVITGSSEGTKNILRTVIENGDKADAETKVYVKQGETIRELESVAEVKSGTKVYISSQTGEEEFSYLVSDISLNGVSVFDEEHFDSDEGAYFVVMPENYSRLVIRYDTAVVSVKESNIIQVSVGDELAVDDYAEMVVGTKEASGDDLEWTIALNDGVVKMEGDRLKAVKEGSAFVYANAKGNKNIKVMFFVEVYENTADMVRITYSTDNDEFIMLTSKYEDDTIWIPVSDYLVKKGSVIGVEVMNDESEAVYRIKANGENVPFGNDIVADKDTQIEVTFAKAVIKGMPETVSLLTKDDTYQLDCSVRYSGLYMILPVYDPSIQYESSDPLVSVDENGLISVTGDIPEDGKAVYVTAYAGSSNRKVYSVCKVVVGNYQGDRIVGRMTISARTISEGQLVAHGVTTFTTYEDIDIDTSFYHYYRPNDKYNDLMIDYRDHPEKYSSDPALCNNNELGLEDRESYFDTFSNGIESEPQTISLVAGESITISNYSYDVSNVTTIMRAIEGGYIASSAQTQELIRQMNLYGSGQEIDGPLAFDSFVSTVAQMYMITKATGKSPANGHSEGGMDINREIFNQFRRDDSQMPNNYYSIYITADELACMKQYLSDPSNNYYSIFAKNCSTGAIDVWNATLFDKPELHLTANYTGFASDPQSLYFELGLLRLKVWLDGEGGTDFYPRTVRNKVPLADVIALIDALGDVEYTPECSDRIEAARDAYDSLPEDQKRLVANYEILTEAEDEYAVLSAFEEYKEFVDFIADTMLKEGDSAACEKLVADAKKSIDETEYDKSKTPRENRDVINDILFKLGRDLDDQRELEVRPLGDVDNDGKVTIIDATYIQMKLAGIEIPFEFDDKYADVDKDGSVTVIDVTNIQLWLASRLPDSDIGKPLQ